MKLLELNHVEKSFDGLGVIKDISLRVEEGEIVSVIGPSGSGKSTLIFEVLAKGGEIVEGLEQFSQVVCLEQASISRNKRSNVATYSGAYDELRALFAASPGAKAAGLQAKHFSFNLPGGRCETCQGLGTVVSNLLFFPEVQLTPAAAIVFARMSWPCAARAFLSWRCWLCRWRTHFRFSVRPPSRAAPCSFCAMWGLVTWNWGIPSPPFRAARHSGSSWPRN